MSSRSDFAGRHSATVRRPDGDASSSTTRTGPAPIRVSANSPALGAVAEERATVGWAPYCAANRRSLRMTCATCAPKMPW